MLCVRPCDVTDEVVVISSRGRNGGCALSERTGEAGGDGDEEEHVSY